MHKKLNARIVEEWQSLMVTQRAMVAEYLLAVGRSVAKDDLTEVRQLLAMQAVEVEVARRLIPNLKPEPL